MRKKEKRNITYETQKSVESYQVNTQLVAQNIRHIPALVRDAAEEPVYQIFR